MNRQFIVITALSLLGAGVLLLGTRAEAHTRSQSFSSWWIAGEDVFFTFSVDARRITQLVPIVSRTPPARGAGERENSAPHPPSLDTLARMHLRRTIAVTAVQGGLKKQNGHRCGLAYLTPAGVHKSLYRFSGKFVCNPSFGKILVDIGAFFDVSPTHIHLARLSDEAGVHDFVLRSGASQFQWSPGAMAPSSFLEILRIGMGHVLGGLDHLVFLLALAVAVRGRRMVVFCVTGFTLGHTAILGLMSHGFVAVEMRLVEALIGFTVVILAIEGGIAHAVARKRALSWVAGGSFLIVSLSALPYFGHTGLRAAGVGMFALALAGYAAAVAYLPKEAAHRLLPAMTLLFGLIHGAGFASGFAALGQPQTALLIPLAGFNIGVEIAQLCVLGLAYGTDLFLMRKAPACRRALRSALGPVIFAMGLFWFVTRVWA